MALFLNNDSTIRNNFGEEIYKISETLYEVCSTRKLEKHCDMGQIT